MGTYFWHSATKKTVYKLSVWATEEWTKHRPPRYNGCHVAGDLTSLSANWTYDPNRGWTNQGGSSLHANYDQGDSPEKAEGFFVRNYRPNDAVEITADQYKDLEAQYDATARATKPKT
jgi:hypothetical protein